MAGDEPWVVLWLPPSATLPFLELIEATDWLEGWTPTQIGEDGKRRPMLPGLAFVPEGCLAAAIEDAQTCGIFGIRPALFNGAMMLCADADLDGLRQAEQALEKARTWKPAVGQTVQVVLFEAIVGIIKRLDAIYAHLDVPGMTSRLVVTRALLQPI